MKRTLCLLSCLWSLGLLLGACSSTYYAVMEQFGVEKREILKDRVVEGRDSQEEAKEQFRSALAAFKDVTGFDGGELEDAYEALNDEFQRCENRANVVRRRIDAIESVAEDLFEEWQEEAAQYADAALRSQSLKMLSDTRGRYGELFAAMKRSEQSMEPVLAAFRDRVLFLKHNLNAQAIAALQGNVAEIESDIGKLVADMEAAIRQANAFISTL